MSSEPRSDPPAPPPIDGNHSKVIRHAGGFEWEQVPIEPYKATTELWKGITRRELIGKRGESPRFHVRYFELAAGGYSTLEKHEHEHAVMVVRGKGEVQFGCYVYQVGFCDMVYVGPDDPHQFRCPEDADEPFGFVCIVNADRDRPQSVDGVGACFICE
jgi:quercetin dioxygenase-like cupin family protein